jgi:hypothetical protein
VLKTFVVTGKTWESFEISGFLVMNFCSQLVATLKNLADRGLTAGCVLANLHHRRIVPLMERRLRIFEMSEDADPVALAESRPLQDPFPREYAATRARRAIDLRPGRCDNASLWAFAMLPVDPLVSEFLDFLSCSVASLWAFAMLPVGPLVSEFLDFLSCSVGFWVVGAF